MKERVRPFSDSNISSSIDLPSAGKIQVKDFSIKN